MKRTIALTILFLTLLAFGKESSTSGQSSSSSSQQKRDTTYTTFGATTAFPTDSSIATTAGTAFLYVAPFVCGIVPEDDTRYAGGVYVSSINILALLDAKLSIQLSINFPPSNQFEPGVTTNSRAVNLLRRQSFTLDCSELLNNAAFDRGSSIGAYISGYALIEASNQLVVFDFISVNRTTEDVAVNPAETGLSDPDVEVLEIQGIPIPKTYSYPYPQGTQYPYPQGTQYPYPQGSQYPQSSQYPQGSQYPYSGQGQQYPYGQGQGQQYPYGQGQGQQYPYSQGQGQQYPYGQGQGFGYGYGTGQGYGNYYY